MSKTVFFIMGVSGCGKSTVGKLLGNRLNMPFYDGDDFHPKENITKMKSGQPLNDEDRMGWLTILNDLAIKNEKNGLVVACSSLKQKYRKRLSQSIEDKVEFIYLKGTFKEIEERMKNRKDHFMPSSLLKSQFDDLEPPTNAIDIPLNLTPMEQVNQILAQIK